MHGWSTAQALLSSEGPSSSLIWLRLWALPAKPPGIPASVSQRATVKFLAVYLAVT